MSIKARWRRWVMRRIPAAAQVQLNQRRIFIMPNRVGAAFAVVLVLMLLAGINYENSLAYGLTFLLTALFVIAILHTYRNFSGLILKAGVSGAVFAGEQARFKVRLESDGRAHHAVGLGWPPQPLQIVDVPPLVQRECELSQPALRRGWLRPERMRVESHFPLGILVAWSWVDLDQTVLVYPRPLEGDLPLAVDGVADENDEGRRAAGQGADDYQGLRSYQPGDSRRRLHWKAFSRGQGLLVKDFAALAGHGLWLDFLALGGDAEERLSRLCYWVLQLDARQQPYGLRLPGTELTPDFGEAHREACLRALALHGDRS
ncbi:DUF58 domain-containing protein [Pseudomonas paralcaligenes]|uniref:DUF58 domain-containing protein n=1 Tax=Pseudomonas paralcaligenes TaxID=2772558 RepID=UPI001C808A67|nr:DUF58 domain-containing protein [Pseudomonas paralcaligenes]